MVRQLVRTCRKHNIDKIYRTDITRPSGRSLHCPKCAQESQKKSNLKAYGLRVEEYRQLLEIQDGCCAICHQPETATNQHGLKSLAVDHDHNTGQVRGLLCEQCNQMIGKAKDNPTILISAAQYLQLFKH